MVSVEQLLLLEVGERTFIRHGRLCTLARKVEDDLTGAFNLELVPPMIIKNALPINLDLKIPQENVIHYL